MKTRTSTNSHCDGSALTARRDLFSAVIVITCIFINSLIPRFALRVDEYVSLQQIISDQKVVLQIFSLPALSVKIMKIVFEGQSWPAAEKTKPGIPQKNQKTSNTSTDFSLFSFDKRVNNGRGDFFQKLPDYFAGNAPRFENAAVLLRTASRSPLPIVIPLCLIAFLFLLPRGGIEDGAGAQLSSNKKHLPSPDPDSRSGFFIYIPRYLLTSGRVLCTCL